MRAFMCESPEGAKVWQTQIRVVNFKGFDIDVLNSIKENNVKKKKIKYKLINLKTPAYIKKQLMAKAKKYACTKKHPHGNLSLWLRMAGTSYTPKQKAS